MAKLSGITATNITWQEAAAPSTPASTKWVSYFKTDGLYYKDDAGAETGPLAPAAGAGNLQSARYVRTAGNYTYTGATAFANVDNTNLNLSITTGTRPVLIVVQASGYSSSAAGAIGLDIELDGARLGGTTGGLVLVSQHSTANEFMNMSFSFITADMTAASHTFKLQWNNANAAHTVTLFGSDPTLLFAVAELYA